MTASAELLAGRIVLRPGAGPPAVRSTRRAWAATIGRDQPAAALPDRLATVFALCGDAHRVAARHAVAAAAGAAPTVTAADRVALQADTLREHLRRLWLDGPQLVGDTPAVHAAALAGCPLLRTGAAPAAARGWIEAHVLGAGAEDWLAQWQAAPRAFIERWAAAGATWPARWLHAAAAVLRGLRAVPRALTVHADADALQALGARIAADEGFALRPHWQGHTAETGSWTRLADPLAGAANNPDDSLYDDTSMRLAARLPDIAHLAAADGDAWLAQGGLALTRDAGAEAEGLGWCEMARGLLIHWVRLAADGRVRDCRVVAPTEWNFHPEGSLARLLAALPPAAPDAQVRLLAAAYDPCVTIDVERAAPGPGHA